MLDTTMIEDEPARTRAVRHDALLEALERLHGTGPEFGGFLSNHGPMVADAMIRFGGRDHVGQWTDHYRRQLDAAPTGRHAIGDENWIQHLGDMRYVGEWIHHFDRAAAEQPWRELLSTWWPRVLPGVAAGAAHGLIRMAHAVRSLATAPAVGRRTRPGPGLLGCAIPAAARCADAAWRLLRARGRTVATSAPGNRPIDRPWSDGRRASIVIVRELPDALDEWAADASGGALDELISVSARLVANRDDAAVQSLFAVC